MKTKDSKRIDKCKYSNEDVNIKNVTIINNLREYKNTSFYFSEMSNVVNSKIYNIIIIIIKVIVILLLLINTVTDTLSHNNSSKLDMFTNN